MKKWIVLLLFALLTAGAYYGYAFYRKAYSANVDLQGKENAFIYIPTGSDLKQVADMLNSLKFITDKASFLWMAEQKKYTGNNVEPGKYEIKNGWSNTRLIEELRGAARRELPVTVTFNNVRTLPQLAGKIAPYIEPDSAQILAVLTNDSIQAHYGFNHYTFMTLFIPNTYELREWDTSPEAFVEKMAGEYKKFWTEARKQKAQSIGLSQSEVAILASIVQAEQGRRADERPRIAGLYINRLKRGIKLESDPTVVFAIGDFSIRRVWKRDLQIDSPYNTYKHKGLPPGPINLPDISSLDAVLNYETHDYIFMCAKPGYEGYHNFSKTNAQHEVYAAEYHRWLRKEGINR